MYKFTFSILSFVLCISIQAQMFELSGQFRPRAEFRNGYHTLSGKTTDPAFSISQRSRLNMLYGSSTVKAMLSLQDVRIWGDVVTANKSDLNGSMIHQAWGEFFLAKSFSVKAGRQAIVYDDQRLFGGSDWNQQARSHDALLLKWNPAKSVNVHLGLVYNQSADKDTGTFYTLDKNYKAMQYLYAHGGNDKDGFSWSLYFANVGMPYSKKVDTVHEQKTAFSQTFGPILFYNKGKLKSNLSFYYQMGTNLKEKTKSAFFAAGEFSYACCKDWTAGAGFQYLSGNDQVNPSDNDQEFSTLFGTGHKFNGWMDYFYAGSSHKGVGLLDIYLPVTYKKGKLSTEFQLHHYRAAAGVKDPGSPAQLMNATLGTEVGIMLSYALAPEVSISGGYSQMFASETMEALKGGDKDEIQNWAWLMFTFNPVFFKSEK